MGAPVIPDWFSAQLGRMADLRNPPSSLHMHWEGLQTMRHEDLERAVTRAIQTRSWFPSPAELREDADSVRTVVPYPVAGELFCEACGDTGFKPVETAKGPAVTVCDCRGTNPVWQQKQQATRKYAEARAK